MKKKFNFKLTAFLAGLFLGLLIVVLGSKNKYCLSFGFIIIGLALQLFILYNNEKIEKALIDIEQSIDEAVDDEELSEEDRAYVVQQLYTRKKQITNNKRKILIVFSISGFALVIFGIINMF